MDILINTYGTKVGASGERIVLSFPNIKEKKEYPIRRIDKIAVLRPASITTHAVQLALTHDVDIVYLGTFGKPLGRLFSSEPKGLARLRRAQLEMAVSNQSFEIAKVLVCGKCRNQIAYLYRMAYIYQKDFAKEIKQAEAILETVSLIPNNDKGKGQFLGVEGFIADRYFTCIKKLFRFPGRKPQGRDKFNSALNYGYGILYNEIERLCLYVGLDPYLGLYHSERYGKPSLVLDLIEEFRVPIVDSAIFPLFVDKKIKKEHFELISKGEYQLSAQGKAIVVEAVMKRLNQRVLCNKKHYLLKDVIEQQIRALGRYFIGKEKKVTTFDVKLLFDNHE